MSLHVFNKNQELIKVIKRTDLQILEQQLELNSIDLMYTEMEVKIWDSLKEKPYYIGIKDIEDEDSYLIYRIMEEQLNMQSVVIKGIGIGFDELKGKGYVPKQPFVKADVQLIMSQILHNTGWQLGYVDNKLGRYDFEIEASTPLDALRSAIEVMGAEIEFKVTLNDNKITNKRINIYRQLGGDYGKRFSYGDEVVEIVREENLTEVVTALYVIGKDYQEPSEIEGADPLEYTLDIVGIEWDMVLGDPVDKPLGKPYIELPEMTKIYGYPDGKPRMGVFEDTSAEDDKELIRIAYEALVEYSRPKVQFTATIDSVDFVRLGETVAILRPDLNFRYKTRVFKITRNHLNERTEHIEFGDVLVKTPHQRYKELSGNIKQESDRLENVIQQAANGKNRIFRGPNEPTLGMIKGDLWYKPIGDGDTELYQWDGEMWALIVSTGVNSQIQQELDEAEERIQDARDEVAETERKANDILTGLGIKGLEVTHQELVDGIQSSVGGRFDSIDDLVVGLDDRLNNISEEITGDFVTEDYVNQKIDYEKGEINTVITGIKNSPEENILGYNIVKQTASGNAREIGRIKESPGSTITGYQNIVETHEQYRRVIGSTTETDGQVRENVARMVMGENIFQTKIGSFTTTPQNKNLLSDRRLGYTMRVSGSRRYVDTVTHFDSKTFLYLVEVDANQAYHLSNRVGVFREGEYALFDENPFDQNRKYSIRTGTLNQRQTTINTTSGSRWLVLEWDGVYTPPSDIQIEKGTSRSGYVYPAVSIASISSSVTQLEDSWALRIEDGDDLVTAINASTKGVYVKGKYITLDGDVDVDGSFSISGELVAKGIKADNITTGTLDAAELNVININAESIVGENANLIKASFNAIQDNLQIDASGIYMLGSGTWRRTYFSATGFDMYNNRGGSGKAGAVGYFKEHSSNANSSENYMRSTANSKHYVGIGVNNSHQFAIGYQEYGSIHNGYTRALEVDGTDGRIRIHTLMSPGGSDYTLEFRAYDGHSGLYGVGLNGYDSGIVLGGKATNIWDSAAKAWDPYNMHSRPKIGFYGNSGIHVLTSNSNMELWAGGGGMHFYNRVNHLKMSLINNLDMNTGINMGGYSISNQSDVRLKHNIHPTDIDSLEAIRQWEIVNYEWIEENKPQGIHLGLIAQDTPEIAVMDPSTGFFNIDSSKQLMMVTHALQQLTEEVKTLKIELETIKNE